MNYDQIEAFLTIVNERSLSKAAEVLYVSQSTVGHRLASLEAELATPLLQRRKGQRSVELTAAGERFVSIAQRWRALWDETQQINEADLCRVLHIGGVESCGCYLLPFFTDFSFRHRDSLKLSINVMSSTLVYSQMESRELDIGFVTIPVWNRNLIFTPILEEGFKVICYDPEGRWPGEIHPKNLDPRRELSQPWNPEYQQWHNYWLPNQTKFYAYVNNSHLMQRRYLEQSGCWTIVADCVAEIYQKFPGFRAVELLSPPPRRTAYMVRHKHPRSSVSDAIERFVLDLEHYQERNGKQNNE